MLVCAECGREVDGAPHVERADDPWDDATPELAWFCETCAEREFGIQLDDGRRRRHQGRG